MMCQYRIDIVFSAFAAEKKEKLSKFVLLIRRGKGGNGERSPAIPGTGFQSVECVNIKFDVIFK